MESTKKIPQGQIADFISASTLDRLLTKEDKTNKSTDGTFLGNSDTKYPSEKATKTYVDTTKSLLDTDIQNEVSRAIASELLISTDLASETSRALLVEDSKEDKSSKNIPDGYAGLDANGKIYQSLLPSITISDTFVVGSETEMLALICETGDLAVRTDLSKTFILKGGDPLVISDWEVLLSPTDSVSSVFGRQGAVVASAGDYNAGQITETTARRFQTELQFLYNDATSSIQSQLNNKEGLIGVKLTAFNKNFGTTIGTVAEGNDSRILNGQTAFSWGNHAGLYSLLNHTHTFASLTSKPTTLAGYGITDAALNSNVLHKTGFASETKSGELVIDSGISDVTGLKFSRLAKTPNTKTLLSNLAPSLVYSRIISDGVSLYISDYTNGTIIKSSFSGVSSILATGLANIESMVLANDGFIYCSGGSNLNKINPTTGEKTIFLAAFGARGIIQGKDGNFYSVEGVGSQAGVRLHKVDYLTKALTLIATVPAGNALCQGADGYLYVIGNSSVIYKTDSQTGAYSTITVTGGANSYNSITVGFDGYLYLSSASSGALFKVDIVNLIAKNITSLSGGGASYQKSNSDIYTVEGSSGNLSVITPDKLRLLASDVTGVVLPTNYLEDILYLRDSDGVKKDSVVYLGTTAVPFNRAPGAQMLEEVSIGGSATLWGSNIYSGENKTGEFSFMTYSNGSWGYSGIVNIKSSLGLGSNAYSSDVYELAFSKNNAFNRSFGNTSLSVAEGNDSRLSDARVASDVYAWAKASVKPSYTKAEVGLSNVDNTTDASKSVSNSVKWNGITLTNATADSGAQYFLTYLDSESTTKFSTIAQARTVLGLNTAAYQPTTAFASATGSANYIQNQNASAQSANMWIDGTIKTVKSTAGWAGWLENSAVGGSGLVITAGDINGIPLLVRKKDGTEIFSMQGTGAATFSSSVTATAFANNNFTGVGLNISGGDGGSGTTLAKFRKWDGSDAVSIAGNGNIYSFGSVTASSFSGAGTGLTGTAAGLNIGGSSAFSTRSSYLDPAYVGGVQTNPQTYFGSGTGLRVAMTGYVGTWSDTLWINGYSGADVKSMCALHFQRNGTPRAYISTQNTDSTTYGTQYELISSYNIANQSVDNSTKLAGNNASNSGGANTIVQRNSNGYIFNDYFHTSGGGSERNTSGMGFFAGFSTGDYYIRSYTPAAVALAISGQVMNINGTAANLSSTRSTWGNNNVVNTVVGQLAWRNYGNGHTIFDASSGTSPDGTAVNNSNSQQPWTGTYPTLMGWDGQNTYGVRVDSARVADYANSAGSASANGGRSDAVTINYSNDSNSTYQMLWGSGTSVYGTAGIYCNPATDSLVASSFVKSGGTSSQYLMADGSVSTGGSSGSTARQSISSIDRVVTTANVWYSILTASGVDNGPVVASFSAIVSVSSQSQLVKFRVLCNGSVISTWSMNIFTNAQSFSFQYLLTDTLGMYYNGSTNNSIEVQWTSSGSNTTRIYGTTGPAVLTVIKAS